MIPLYRVTRAARMLAASALSPFVSSDTRWRLQLPSEVAFWDAYFRTQGMGIYAEHYQLRLDPSAPFLDTLRPYLPVAEPVAVLDVGAGPISPINPRWPGRTIHVTAVDPLAAEYDRILARYGIIPRVRTVAGDGEMLTEQFPAAPFDLAYAANCLDHSYDPLRAITQMLAVVKPGGWVVLDHNIREGAHQRYRGLHQWDFTERDGDLWIATRTRAPVSVSAHLAGRGTLSARRIAEDTHPRAFVTIQRH